MVKDDSTDESGSSMSDTDGSDWGLEQIGHAAWGRQQTEPWAAAPASPLQAGRAMGFGRQISDPGPPPSKMGFAGLPRDFGRPSPRRYIEATYDDLNSFAGGVHKALKSLAGTFDADKAKVPVPLCKGKSRLCKEVPLSTKVREAEEGTVIIFDWDDTLFPTFFISTVVEPLSSDSQDGYLPDAFADDLEQHARVVESTLRTARSLGKVAIVTLARRPWVLSSSRKYLPGLDMERLLDELGIPVAYAGESSNRSLLQADLQEGISIYDVLKRAAMEKVIRKLLRRTPWKNIISIGDSNIERRAVQDLFFCCEEAQAGTRCKTVKLSQDSTLENCSTQLRMMKDWLRTMVFHEESFDTSFEEEEEDFSIHLP